MIVYPSGLLLFLLDQGPLLKRTTGMELLWPTWTSGPKLNRRSTKPWTRSTLGSIRSTMEPSEHMTREKEDLMELMIAVVARIEDQKDMQKGTYVEEEVESNKDCCLKSIEGALQYAKKTSAQ